MRAAVYSFSLRGAELSKKVGDFLHTLGYEVQVETLPKYAEEAKLPAMVGNHYEVTEEAAEKINAARANGGRLLCIGTTSMRTIETAADENGIVHAGSGMTNIFIKPGVKIKAVDMLLTNFHLPQSTLLMLISALMGREEALRVYREAVEEKYRFFSFGDAMLIL